jgi:hypothetical protein
MRTWKETVLLGMANLTDVSMPVTIAPVDGCMLRPLVGCDGGWNGKPDCVELSVASELHNVLDLEQ